MTIGDFKDIFPIGNNHCFKFLILPRRVGSPFHSRTFSVQNQLEIVILVLSLRIACCGNENVVSSGSFLYPLSQLGNQNYHLIGPFQSFSIKSCLVLENGLMDSDIAVLKSSTECLVQGGAFNWPSCSILQTSSSIPTRKASFS